MPISGIPLKIDNDPYIRVRVLVSLMSAMRASCDMVYDEN